MTFKEKYFNYFERTQSTQSYRYCLVLIILRLNIYILSENQSDEGVITSVYEISFANEENESLGQWPLSAVLVAHAGNIFNLTVTYSHFSHGGNLDVS